MKGNASTSLMKTLISKKPSNGIVSGSSLLISKNQQQSNSPVSPTNEKAVNLSPTSLTKLSQKTGKSGTSLTFEASNVQQQNNANTSSQSVSNSESSPSLLSISVNNQIPSTSCSPIGTRFAFTMLGLTANTNKSDQNLFQKASLPPEKAINNDEVNNFSPSAKNGTY